MAPNIHTIKSLVKSSNIVKLVKANYVTSDIIALLLSMDKQAAAFTKDIATQFKGRNITETCRNIWDFLKQNITYQEDKDGEQNLKSPANLIATGIGDCKSYSLFTASILKNLGIPYSYRFAGFGKDGIPTHVYIVAKGEEGQDIIVDAVYSQFNKEKKPTFKKDVMAGLNYIAGIGAGAKPQLSADDFFYTNFLQRVGNLTFFTTYVENKLIEASTFFIYLFADPNSLPPAAAQKRQEEWEILQALLKKTNLKQEAALRFIKAAIAYRAGKTVEQILPASYYKYLDYKKPFLAPYLSSFASLQFPAEPVHKTLDLNYANDMVAWEAAKAAIVGTWANSVNAKATAAGALSYDAWAKQNRIGRIGDLPPVDNSKQVLTFEEVQLMIQAVIALISSLGGKVKAPSNSSAPDPTKDFPNYSSTGTGTGTGTGTNTTASSTPSWLLPAGIGLAAYFLFLK